MSTKDLGGAMMLSHICCIMLIALDSITALQAFARDSCAFGFAAVNLLASSFLAIAAADAQGA